MPAQTCAVRALIDHDKYPIDETDSAIRDALVGQVRAVLAKDGCAVLSGFLSTAGQQRLLDEIIARLPLTYQSPSTRTNVYFSPDDPSLPDDHPCRLFMHRSNGFITSDLLGEETNAWQLYHCPALERFLADCLGKDKLHIYADPISNMIVNVGKPGTEFNWHFDTNEFTITLMLRPAQSGGLFEYAPNLRSSEDECYDDVRAVLQGDRERVVQLDLQPGDMQLFLGRYSLHRVTENLGLTDRLLLIMSFTEKAGMIGSLHRVRELYGKITEVHLQAERERVRNDALMD